MLDSNFIDYVKIFFRSGKGGKGSAHFHRAKGLPQGGPDAVPYTNSVGKGTGYLLRDGKRYDITWSRSSSTATTSYKFKNGNKVRVTGQPWIYLVPTNLTTSTFTLANGSKSKVTTNFDTLNYVPVKGVKVKVKITGKGYVTLTTSAAGTVTVKASSAKVAAVTIAKQTSSGQKYAYKVWKK